MKCCSSFGMLVGRILLSLIFIFAGTSKFMDYESNAAYMVAKGMTMVPFFLYAAAVVELTGGLSLLLGLFSRWGATLLILFLIPVTGLFHDFWNLTDPREFQMNMIFFFENMGLIGGLLYVASTGPGKYSLGCLLCPKCKEGTKE